MNVVEPFQLCMSIYDVELRFVVGANQVIRRSKVIKIVSNDGMNSLIFPHMNRSLVTQLSKSPLSPSAAA